MFNYIKNFITQKKAICINCKYCNSESAYISSFKCLKFENTIVKHPITGREVRRDNRYDTLFSETNSKYMFCEDVNSNGNCHHFKQK